ncbi:MAG: polysaccharide biosynthesis C-terminal domain-containing protein [Ruminococcus sp.]|nr:polysaccharide biosynthesis C-terminal domain-containing protein [Ruminococcus sp.]
MKRQGFLKGSAILLGMVVITKSLGLLFKIPLTHMLEGTGMGYFSSAFAVFTPIFAIVVAGIPSTIARMTAENYAFERYCNVRKIKRCAMALFSLLGLLAAVLVIMLSRFLSVNVIKEPNAVWALIAVAPSIPAATVLSVERGYYEGLKNMLPTAISEIVETIFKLVFGLGFAYLVLNYAKEQYYLTGACFGEACKTLDEAIYKALPFITGAAVLGVSLSTCVASIYIIISGRIHGDGISREMLGRDKTTDKTGKLFKALFANAFPIAIAAVINTLTNTLDLISINSCIRKAMAADKGLFYELTGDNLTRDMIPNFIYGSYSGLALMVFGLVPTLTAMFGKSILPSLSEAWVTQDKAALRKRLGDMLLITTIIAFPAGIGTSFLSKEILEFLFSGRTNEIAVSQTPLCILGAAVILEAITIPCLSALQTIGKLHLPVIISLVGGAVKLIFNLVLIPLPSVNINGAAISAVISQAVICVWAIGALLKSAGIKVSYKRIFLKPFFASILCGMTARLCYDIFTRYLPDIVNFRIIIVFAIFFAVIMHLFSLYLLCVMPKNQVKSLIFRKNY